MGGCSVCLPDLLSHPPPPPSFESSGQFCTSGWEITKPGSFLQVSLKCTAAYSKENSVPSASWLHGKQRKASLGLQWREQGRAFPWFFILSSGRKFQTTRRITFTVSACIRPPCFLSEVWGSLPVPRESRCCATPEPLCSAHSSFEPHRISKRVFSAVVTSAVLPNPGTSKWAITEKQRRLSAAAGGSSELELYLLHAWEAPGTAQSCALIHGQAEDRQGRCCINHSSLELENS